jgi:hypothetical protein
MREHYSKRSTLLVLDKLARTRQATRAQRAAETDFLAQCAPMQSDR